MISNINNLLAEAAANPWKVYYYIAIFSTILFIFKLILFSFTGGGESEVIADFNTETDTDPSFGFFSFQSITAFFMGFGWMGYAALTQFSFGHKMSFLLAFAVGFMFMFMSATLMFLAKKLEKKVTNDKADALNKIGKAYTSFHPDSNGQIEIEINGKLQVANAVNKTKESINSFDLVRVVKVQNDLLYIEKVKK